MSWWQARRASFGHAGRGIARMLREEPNARIHFAATLAVIVLAAWLRVSPIGAALLAFAIALVFTAEAINTALETLSDRLSPEQDAAIGRAKDLAAGAVLVSACGAAVVGLLVLGPPLLRRILA